MVVLVAQMTSQQIGDEALSIYQSNRDDQVRMDSLLRTFFSEVRADEYEHQLRCVELEMSKCASPEITNSSFSLPSSEASSWGA
jgi:RecA/RadA recombinase